MLSYIGTFGFVRMSALPAPPAEQIALESRAGVNGVGAWKTGVRGRELTIDTVADMVDQTDAIAALGNYTLLCGAAPQSLIYAGHAMIYQVLVLEVEPVEVAATLLGVGGRLGISHGLLAARWKLIPVMT